MYVNPFVAGIFVTIGIEAVLLLVTAVVLAYKNSKK